jgi:glycosyltransferase involved in cell wall biosynthesis
MRIALFAETFLPKIDGVTNTLCHLLRHLALRKHDCLVFAPEGGPPSYAGAPIVGLPCFAFPLYPDLRLVAPAISVEQEMAAFEPELVLLINPALLGLVGLRHARDLDLPVVASYHTDIPGYTEKYGLGLLRDPAWAYFRWLHNQADLNLCPSDFTRRELEAQGFERLRIFSRGVDATRFHPTHRSLEWRRRLCAGDPDAPLLLYVGRLAVEKRIEWLRPVLDRLPGARLAIVGDGPSRPALETLFEGTPTLFTGLLQGQDLSSAYASADVFVFPAANETFGNVVLEAMASGLPVVVSRSGGQVDHVRHGENGLLFPTEDQAALVDAVHRLATDLPYAHQLGVNALAYAQTQTWERTFDTLLGNLEKVLADPRRAEHATVVPHREPGAAVPKQARSLTRQLLVHRHRRRPRAPLALWRERTRAMPFRHDPHQETQHARPGDRH